MAEPRQDDLPTNTKKSYCPPGFQVYGSIAVITAATNMGTMADGGLFPNTKTA